MLAHRGTVRGLSPRGGLEVRLLWLPRHNIAWSTIQFTDAEQAQTAQHKKKRVFLLIVYCTALCVVLTAVLPGTAVVPAAC